MSKFVIKHKTSGKYLRTRIRGWGSLTVLWVDSPDTARVYSRKCDASNSILGNFGSNYYRSRNSEVDAKDLEIVPVTLSITSADAAPAIKISPEVLDRATRYMMTDEARQNGAPSSLVDSFDDLETDQIVKLVTTLYGNK